MDGKEEEEDDFGFFVPSRITRRQSLEHVGINKERHVSRGTFSAVASRVQSPSIEVNS